jgi:hypothetical protein
VLSGSRSSRLTSGTEWIESWVDIRADLGAVENRANLTLAGNRNPVPRLPGPYCELLRLRIYCSERTSKEAQETQRLERSYCLSGSHDPRKQTRGSLLEFRLLPEQGSGRRYVVCCSTKIGQPTIGRHAM